MIDLNNHSIHGFYDVCSIERSKSGKIYTDAIAIPLSAVDGSRAGILGNRMHLIGSPEQIDTDKGLGIIAVRNGYDVEYLYYILQDTLQDFLVRYQCGININPEIFKFYEIDVHNDIETQKYVAAIMRQMEYKKEQENKIINKLKNIKQYYLENMLCDCAEARKTEKHISEQGLFDFAEESK